MITKSRVTNFIIMRPNTTVATAASRLYDFTTDVINIPVGGFGLYTPVVGSSNPIALAAGAITSATNSIQFIQHRDKANDRTPLYNSTLEQSPVITRDCPLRAVGTAASTKQNSTWVVGDVAANVGAVPVMDETEYIVNAATSGWKIDLYNGNNTPLKMARFTTPDYFASTIYTTDNQRRDHLMQHLAFDFNNQSSSDVVAICIDTAATSSTASTNVTTIAAAAALSPGAVIIIGFSDAGQPIKLTLDASLIQTFGAIVSGGIIPGTAQIVPYARPTSANTSVATRLIAGGTTAGTTDATVDRLVFIALDQSQAYYDEVASTKSKVRVGLESGFGGMVLSTALTDSSEGSGYYKDVLQYYRDSAGHRKYLGGKPWQSYHVEFPTELVPGAIYDIFILDSCANRTASSGLPSVSPLRTVIAVANFETPGFALYTGTPNPQKAFVQTALNTFMATTQYAHTAISI